MNQPSRASLGLSLLLSVLAVPAGAEQSCGLDVVTFEEGAEGWAGPAGPGGSTVLEETGGFPDGHLHTVFNDFGITFRTDSNPIFVQDLSAHDEVMIGVDLKVESIDFFGTAVTRPWLVEIRDRDDPPAGYPWVSVWYLFEWVGAGDWRAFEVTIDDPDATGLPPGWGGTGDEDPETYEPRLPADRTFASVLAGADEIAFTTLQPGWGFGFTDFDLRVDNIRLAACSDQDCPGDLNGDGRVDGEDLTRLLGVWGSCEGGCAEDLDGDEAVDGADLSILLAYWGPCAG